MGSVGDRYPLNGVDEVHARQFLAKYRLRIDPDLFIRGFLAFRHRHDIEPRLRRKLDSTSPPYELKIGDHEYKPLEVEVLQQFWTRGKWETLRHMSRLHWLLIVACIFAAMTQ